MLKRFATRLWRAWGITRQLLSARGLLQLLGWWPTDAAGWWNTAVATLIAAGCGVWSILVGSSGPMIAVVTILAFGGSLFVAERLRVRRGMPITGHVVASITEPSSTNPKIEIMVGSGNPAHIVVKNTGGPFTLVTRARIVGASGNIDRTIPYQFDPRDVNGGDDISSYTIADLGEADGRLIAVVYGEHMDPVQRWEIGQHQFWFEVEWTVQAQDSTKILNTLETVVTRIALADRRRFNVSIKPKSRPATSGEIADGERRYREWKAGAFQRPIRVEHVHRVSNEHARRVDERTDKIEMELKKTIGLGVHETLREMTRAIAVAEITKENAVPIRPSWGTHSNGLTLRGRGTSPDIVLGATCIVTDIRRWSEEHQKWAQTSDLHQGGAFAEMMMPGRKDVGLDDTVDFGFLHLGPDRLTLHGQSDTKPIIQPGMWAISCRITDATSRQSTARWCLRWDGGRNQPVAVDCTA